MRFPVTDLNNGDSSTALTTSSLHRFPYNSLPSLQLTNFQPCPLLLTSRHRTTENSSSIVTQIISMGMCLFAKALPSNGCVYLLIKNLLPSSECCFVVCFEATTQQWLYTLTHIVLWHVGIISFHMHKILD
jgi:hypothetical protein